MRMLQAGDARNESISVREFEGCSAHATWQKESGL
jgi:hypothetical protein